MNTDYNIYLKQLEKEIESYKNHLSKELNNLLDEHNYFYDLSYNYNASNEIEITNDIEEYYKKRNDLSKNIEDQYLEEINNISPSNGSEYFDKYPVNIGIICDEFLFNSLKDTANFVYINYENYIENEKKLDLLFIATTWKGLDDSWVGLGNPNKINIRKNLFEIINYFKSKNKKVVFYSKEDPVNYSIFVDIAKNCDYIFTTSEEKIDEYKRDCNNNNVFVLEFGVNPLYNNPIGMKLALDKFALFAGSWYKKYPKRQKDTELIFDGIIESGVKLSIVDRNYYRKSRNYLFPEKYLEYISPSINHNVLQKLHKIAGWCVNLNSVQNSSTMFANRVLELQAMGNIILSNYSLAINNFFPNIFMVYGKSELEYIFKSYTEYELIQHRLQGIRKVLKEHTTFHRMNFLLNKIGITNKKNLRKKVGVLYKNKTPHLIDNFNRQTFPEKELVHIDYLEDAYRKFDYLIEMSDDHIYEEYFLEDMVNGFKYTDCHFITKNFTLDDNVVSEEIHNYVTNFKNVNRTMFSTKKTSFKDIYDVFIGEVIKSNLTGYCLDNTEVSYSNFTVNISYKSPKVSVVIPVYNNGEHLYGKCFMSLRRSSLFSEMEIIIVDDGSKDENTIKIIERLQRKYKNIKTFFYNDGGSGSASRPRNKGVEIATSDYIMFLDPDNESINDGIAKLYKYINKSDYDFVIGNIIKADTEVRHVNYYEAINKILPNISEIGNNISYDLLVESSFKSQSIQAIIMKKDFLVENNLKMVEGAIGEDTLFFFELLMKGRQYKIINEPIHVYYAKVTGSTVNSITSKTFERYEILEHKKIEFFKQNDLLKPFMKLRFSYYFKNWYLKKLNAITDQNEKEKSKDVLKRILNMYIKQITNISDDELQVELYDIARLLEKG